MFNNIIEKLMGVGQLRWQCSLRDRQNSYTELAANPAYDNVVLGVEEKRRVL